MLRILKRPAVTCVSITILFSACGAEPRPASSENDTIARLQQLERERLQALVMANLEIARRVHADDFQLITPSGAALSRSEYLDQIESGEVDYLAWEAGDIVVRLYGNAAMIRYRDLRFDVNSLGQAVHRGPMFHTNLYERRGDEWQVVWSQASGQIMSPQP